MLWRMLMADPAHAHRHPGSMAAFAFVLIVGARSAPAQDAYIVTQVGPLGHHSTSAASSAANAIAREKVAGSSSSCAAECGPTRAIRYEPGALLDLGSLGGFLSEGWGVNAQGDVVGISITSAGAFHAFLSHNGNMTDLGTLGGSAAAAYAIND